MALRAFEDQIPAIRTGLQEFNLAVKLGVTDNTIATTGSNAALVTAIQALNVFGDQQYLTDVVIAGAMRMSKTLGPMSDANCSTDATIAAAQANFTAMDPNLPINATDYGMRNWDSN